MTQVRDHLKPNPEIRSFVLEDIFGDDHIGDNDQDTQVEQILDYVKRRVRYIRDPLDSENLTSPLLMIETIRRRGFVYGDCDDHALFFSSLLASVGIDSEFVGVKLNKATNYNHVIVSVYRGGRWVDMDPCSKYAAQPDYFDRLVL